MKNSTSTAVMSSEEKKRSSLLEESGPAMDNHQPEAGVMTRAQYRRMSLSLTQEKKKSPVKKLGKKTPCKSIAGFRAKADTPNDIISKHSPLKTKDKSKGSRLSLKIKNTNDNNAESLGTDQSPCMTIESPTLPSKTSSRTKALAIEMPSIRNTPEIKSKQKLRHSKEFTVMFHETDKLLDEMNNSSTKSNKSQKRGKSTVIVDDKIESVVDEVKEEEDSAVPVDDTDAMNTYSPKKKKLSKKMESTETVDKELSDVDEIKEEEDSSVPVDIAGSLCSSSPKEIKMSKKQKFADVVNKELPEVEEIKEEEDSSVPVDHTDAMNSDSPKKKKMSKRQKFADIVDKELIEVDEIKEEEDSSMPVDNTDAMNTYSPKKKKMSKQQKFADVVDKELREVDEIKEEEDSSVPVDNAGSASSSSPKKKKMSKQQRFADVVDKELIEVDEIKEEEDSSVPVDNAHAINSIISSPKKLSKKLKPSNIQPLLESEEDEVISSQTLTGMKTGKRSMLVGDDEAIRITSPTKAKPTKSARESVDGRMLNRPMGIENGGQNNKAAKTVMQGAGSAHNTVSRSSAQALVGKVGVPNSKTETKSVSKKTVIEDDSDSDDDSDAECRKEIMRSAEKRIIRNISTSESESRNVKTFLFNKDSTGNDSDSAPDDVTFDASRKSALDLLKHTVDSIKRDKLKKKEQRKERLEILRLRKEENLIRLKERKANQEDASCSSSEESVHEKHAQLNKYELLSKAKKTYFVEEPSGKTKVSAKQVESKVTPVTEKQASGLKRLPSDLLENLPDQIPKKMKTSYHMLPAAKPIQSIERLEKMKDHGPTMKHKRDVDFIPIDGNCSTQFGVVALDKPKLKTVAQQAADFRHNMLYGNRVSRVPGNVHIKYQQKLKFVNKK